MALIAGPSVAHAQTPQDLSALRRDMETLRKDYEAKVDDLETRLAKAEAEAAAAKQAAEQAQAAAASQPPVDTIEPPATVASGAPASQNAFNPAISAVLNGFATVAGEETGNERIAGISNAGEIGYPPRGLSLSESEVSLSANIDPSFYGFLVVALDGEGEAAVEEAYIRTTALPGGLTITAGRMFSGIGYANELHAHNWAFSDQALPYRAFLGSQLGDDGVQLRWLAPTDFYLEFGAEAFRGESYPAGGADDNGVGTYTAFARAGGDIDVSSSYLASLSYLHARALDREADGDLFTGNSDLLIGSLTYKWAPNGNLKVRNFAATAEVFVGNEDGVFNGAPVDQDRFGWYAQGVYQFTPGWRAGLRFAGLRTDDPGPLLAGTALDDLGRDPFSSTALLEYDPSEFSRFRLQYSHDESDVRDNDILTLQYTVIYGPHGAHRY